MNNAQIRKIIAQFLREWIEWVEADADENHLIFARNKGLCGSLRHYLIRSLRMDNAGIHEVSSYFFDELLFGDVTPFNRGNQKSYPTEAREKTMHKNQARRMWAYETLRELSV